MSSSMPFARARRRRRTITYLWILALGILIISLIYWEQTALLYIIATLGVTALLVVVAAADLHGSERAPGELSPPNDAAAIGSGITSTFGSQQIGRSGKRRG